MSILERSSLIDCHARQVDTLLILILMHSLKECCCCGVCAACLLCYFCCIEPFLPFCVSIDTVGVLPGLRAYGLVA